MTIRTDRTRTSRPIEPSLRANRLVFGDVAIEFQRTLRIPDDGREYFLPPGLGRFPVLPVSRFADRVPEPWRRRGGVFIPMHQREALWINFQVSPWHRAAVKVGIGKVNAVTGDPWTDRLQPARNGRKQDYLVLPDQPWLDGINVGDGRIRQFVAVPLGSGYTVEGQVTGEETWGGIQLLVVPGKPIPRPRWDDDRGPMLMARMAAPALESASPMGLGAGGLMRQHIYEDENPFGVWQQDRAARVFVHIANAALFAEITGMAPPPSPITAQDYSRAGLPWFDLYDADRAFLQGSDVLGDVWSIAEMDEARIGPAAPIDESIDFDPGQIVGTPHAGPANGLDGEW
jgi:hypothetical protein